MTAAMSAEAAAATESGMSYLGSYVDTIESLPLELQRNFTLIKQLDQKAENIMEQVASQVISVSNEQNILSTEERRKRLQRIGKLLNEALKRGEEKFALAKSTYDAVDKQCSRLDMDLQKFEDEQLIGPGRITDRSNAVPAAGSVPSIGNEPKEARKRGRPTSVSRGRKRKGRKGAPKEEDQAAYIDQDPVQRAQAAISLSNLPIDPNEPVYCYCRQVSFGEMVACDNDDCEIEWFHLGCVGLDVPPAGKWYCDTCAKQFKSKTTKK